MYKLNYRTFNNSICIFYMIYMTFFTVTASLIFNTYTNSHFKLSPLHKNLRVYF